MKPMLLFTGRGARGEALRQALEAAALNPVVVSDGEALARHLESGAAALVFACLDTPPIAGADGSQQQAEEFLAVQRELVEKPLQAFAKIEPSLSQHPVPVLWLTPALAHGKGAAGEALALAAASLHSWAALLAARHGALGVQVRALAAESQDLRPEVEVIRSLALRAA